MTNVDKSDCFRIEMNLMIANGDQFLKWTETKVPHANFIPECVKIKACQSDVVFAMKKKFEGKSMALVPIST